MTDPETAQEKLERLEAMLQNDGTWDLSESDLDAIREGYKALRSKLYPPTLTQGGDVEAGIREGLEEAATIAKNSAWTGDSCGEYESGWDAGCNQVVMNIRSRMEKADD